MDYSNRNQNDRSNDPNNERDQYRRENDDNSGQGFGNRGSYESRNQYENYNQNRSQRGDSGGNNDDQNRNWRDENSSRSNRNRGNEGNQGGSWNQGSGDWGQGNERNQRSDQGGDRGNFDSGRNRGYGQSFDSGRNQDYGNSGRQEDRNWFDRTKDEVSSWFNDEDAERRRRQDRNEGQHRGKGPKGYKRSDERMKDDINERLSDDPHVDASDIDVTVSNGEVTLNGTVDSRQAKRRAEDIAESVSGVSHVQNNLRMSQQNSGMGSGSSNAGAGSQSAGNAASSAGSANTAGASASATGANDQRKEKASH